LEKLIINKIKKNNINNNKIFINNINSLKFALKVYKKGNENLLSKEINILLYLKGFGIPSVISHVSNNVYNLLLMELLCETLDQLFEKKNKKFSIKTMTFRFSNNKSSRIHSFKIHFS